jgi:hypothetical protein
MIVRKVRGEDRVGKIIVTPTEAMLAKRMGIPLEKYVQTQLVFIAKKRRWKWYFNNTGANYA